MGTDEGRSAVCFVSLPGMQAVHKRLFEPCQRLGHHRMCGLPPQVRVGQLSGQLIESIRLCQGVHIAQLQHFGSAGEGPLRTHDQGAEALHRPDASGNDIRPQASKLRIPVSQLTAVRSSLADPMQEGVALCHDPVVGGKGAAVVRVQLAE